jgi:hypothetical protein
MGLSWALGLYAGKPSLLVDGIARAERTNTLRSPSQNSQRREYVRSNEGSRR